MNAPVETPAAQFGETLMDSMPTDFDRLIQGSVNQLIFNDARMDRMMKMAEILAKGKVTEREAEHLKLLLKTEMQDAETLLDDNNRPLLTWRSSTRRSVDTAALKSAGLYETYTKVTESRTFKLKGEK